MSNMRKHVWALWVIAALASSRQAGAVSDSILEQNFTYDKLDTLWVEMGLDTPPSAAWYRFPTDAFEIREKSVAPNQETTRPSEYDVFEDDCDSGFVELCEEELVIEATPSAGTPPSQEPIVSGGEVSVGIPSANILQLTVYRPEGAAASGLHGRSSRLELFLRRHEKFFPPAKEDPAYGTKMTRMGQLARTAAMELYMANLRLYLAEESLARKCYRIKRAQHYQRALADLERVELLEGWRGTLFTEYERSRSRFGADVERARVCELYQIPAPAAVLHKIKARIDAHLRIRAVGEVRELGVIIAGVLREIQSLINDMEGVEIPSKAILDLKREIENVHSNLRLVQEDGLNGEPLIASYTEPTAFDPIREARTGGQELVLNLENLTAQIRQATMDALEALGSLARIEGSCAGLDVGYALLVPDDPDGIESFLTNNFGQCLAGLRDFVGTQAAETAGSRLQDAFASELARFSQRIENRL